MIGWLALVAALSGAHAVVAASSHLARARFDVPMLLVHLAAAGVGGVLVAHDVAWIAPTLIAAGGAVLHTARLRRTTTHDNRTGGSDGS